MCNLE